MYRRLKTYQRSKQSLKWGCILSLFISSALFSQESPKSVNTATEINSSMTDMEYFNSAISSMEDKNWKVALQDLSAIREKFPTSQMFNDSLYFHAVCNYHLQDYATANKELTQYLSSKYKLKFFEDALQYKLAIANNFKEGAKKHLFDSEVFPKWIPARDDALQIYDEVLEMVPTHDLAASALYEKGHLLQKMQDYKGALENYHTLVKRFPKHSMTASAYLSINESYYEQSFSEFRNTDLLQLAQVNLKKFEQNYPRDPKVEQAKQYFRDMKEIHAKGLYQIGKFYERTKKPKASVIYYVTALEKFPDCQSTDLCRERLNHLQSELNDLKVSKDVIR